MKKLLFAVILLAGLAASAFSQENTQRRPVLGILPFTGGTGDDSEAIAALLSMEPEILRAFTVVPRTAALDAIFAEHYFQLAGLTDSDTIAGIGRLLNADYVLSGSIRQLGERSLVIATVVNVETFEQVAGYYRTYLAIEEVRDFLPSMSRSMIADTLERDAAGLPSLAILPFSMAAGVDALDAETLSMILAIEILNAGNHVVLPRTSTIQAALSEIDFQMQGYTEDEGMVALGRAINADLVLSGGIHRLGALNMFTAHILRVADGSVVIGASRDYLVIDDGIYLMAELAIFLTDPDHAETRIAAIPRRAPSVSPGGQHSFAGTRNRHQDYANRMSIGATALANFNTQTASFISAWPLGVGESRGSTFRGSSFFMYGGDINDLISVYAGLSGNFTEGLSGDFSSVTNNDVGLSTAIRFFPQRSFYLDFRGQWWSRRDFSSAPRSDSFGLSAAIRFFPWRLFYLDFRGSWSRQNDISIYSLNLGFGYERDISDVVSIGIVFFGNIAINERDRVLDNIGLSANVDFFPWRLFYLGLAIRGAFGWGEVDFGAAGTGTAYSFGGSITPTAGWEIPVGREGRFILNPFFGLPIGFSFSRTPFSISMMDEIAAGRIEVEAFNIGGMAGIVLRIEW